MKRYCAVTVACLMTLMIGCMTNPKSPKGFALPEGNAERGQAVFVELSCSSCHTVSSWWSKLHCFFCDLPRHAINLKHDTARIDPAGPVFRRSLAFTHAYLGRLLRHRHIGEQPDPHAARALHLTRHRAPRGLDLPRRDAGGLLRLQPEGAADARRGGHGGGG